MGIPIVRPLAGRLNTKRWVDGMLLEVTVVLSCRERSGGVMAPRIVALVPMRRARGRVPGKKQPRYRGPAALPPHRDVITRVPFD